MKFIYIVFVFFSYYILNSYERITSQKITTTTCENENYKIYCTNANLLEIEEGDNLTKYNVKSGNQWTKIYVKQCIHEITKDNNSKTEECRPCYYKTYQDICKTQNYNVYCNSSNFEKSYCKQVEYIIN